MSKRIALYRGSFDPPGRHQREAVAALAGRFDEVVVIPHGPWPDTPELADTSPIHRATLADMTFGDLPNTRVELSDLERGVFTFDHEYEAEFAAQGEVSHVVTAPEVEGGSRGESSIHRDWDRGPEMWGRLHFTVLESADSPADAEDLPPNSEVVRVERIARSREIRDRVYHRQPINEWVVPRAKAYIERHNLAWSRCGSRPWPWRSPGSRSSPIPGTRSRWPWPSGCARWRATTRT